MPHGSRPLRGILCEEASRRLQKGPGEAASIRRLASSSRPKESPKALLDSTRPAEDDRPRDQDLASHLPGGESLGDERKIRR
jgi:hypothetical protein